MTGWLVDTAYMIAALFYWNARKSWFRLRGRRGPAPCQNPRDSGRAMQTGCEACLGWEQPARFGRVCPLLRIDARGGALCSVDARDVRPFWGRALGYVGGAVAVVALIAVIALHTAMRRIGYEVTWRQIAWPPAWAELPGVRVDLFIRQARAHYTAGRVREAIQALATAHQLDPAHYQVAMLLARFQQVGNPAQSDPLYQQLLQGHPEKRVEIARAWLQSLLARGQWGAIARLARSELPAEPAATAVWTQAALFAARQRPREIELAAIAADPAVPAGARAVLALAHRVAPLAPAPARKALLDTPTAAGFAFDRAYRAEALIRLGFPREGLEVASAAQAELPGRDVARLAWAAYVGLHDRARLAADFASLLAPPRRPRAVELASLATHLVRAPDPALLKPVLAALPGLPADPAEDRIEAIVVVFCAAGAGEDYAGMAAVREFVVTQHLLNPGSLDRLGMFFRKTPGPAKLDGIPAGSLPLSFELMYALWERRESAGR